MRQLNTDILRSEIKREPLATHLQQEQPYTAMLFGKNRDEAWKPGHQVLVDLRTSSAKREWLSMNKAADYHYQ